MNNAKQLTAEDMNCSEDEFSDFLIDMFYLSKECAEMKKTYSFTIIPKKDEIIKITILDGCFYKSS
jgi:hypothetical protein